MSRVLILANYQQMTIAAKNWVIRTIGTVIVCCQNRNAPTDAEFDAGWKIVQSQIQDASRVRILVITEGGGPTPNQRKVMQQALAGKAVRNACVSDSVKIKFIMATVALFNSEAKLFPSWDMTGAFDFLGLDDSERFRVEQALTQMKKELQQSEATAGV